MSMMPGSSRAYILELEQDKAMLQGALEAATEQVERLKRALFSTQTDVFAATAEADRLRKRGESYDAGYDEGWAAGKKRGEAGVERLRAALDYIIVLEGSHGMPNINERLMVAEARRALGAK